MRVAVVLIYSLFITLVFRMLEEGEIVDSSGEETESPAKKPHIPVAEQKKRTLFLGGLRYATKEENIREYFKDLRCDIADIYLSVDKEGKTKHFAFVTLKKAEDADRVLKMTCHKILDRKVTIQRPVGSFIPGMPHTPISYEEYSDQKPTTSRKRWRHDKYGFHDHEKEREHEERWEAIENGNWTKRAVSPDDSKMSSSALQPEKVRKAQKRNTFAVGHSRLLRRLGYSRRSVSHLIKRRLLTSDI
ncbi:hypothetical protein L596_022494 [Steinernema carpocapsae]|uniref:RRM domain-containing protein n=1 Tax=Steinernema carpocapsae TaxID=34508 RepID=A0A4U5MLU7_STECR|nr:hypothetical protein L596_022494 [Steinernema carpocapsae]